MTNMSVIIRLQNLPWSANAADIRAYFHGLSIPEGGVHIVGGEQGDAFIAFSTDEDARQAMLLDGGKLKEIKIKLYLSSRTEMLKVIEQARQQAIKLQSLITANPPAAQVVPPAPTIIPRKSEEEIKEPTPEDVNKTREKDEDTSNNKRDRKDRSLSRDKSRSGRSKDGDRTRDRSRNRDRRDRERDRRRRDRSRSRDRYRSRRSRSRERRRSGREESKESSHRGVGGGVGRRSRESEDDKNEMSGKNDSNQSWELQHQQTQQQLPPSKQPLLPDPPAIPQMLQMLQHNGKDPIQQNLSNAPLQPPIINYVSTDPERRHFPGAAQMPQMGGFAGMPPMRMREGWPTMPGPMGPMPLHLDPSQLPLQRPPLLMPDMPLSTFPPQGFPPQSVYSTGADHPMWRMMAHHPDANVDHSDAESCVEIRGLPLNASYIDVKKLFDGLSIPSDGIKMINDTQGNRTGIAYVKFSNNAQKKSALNQNGKKVRSNVVEVLHLRDDIYRTAVDNYKPEKDSIKEVDMDIDNGESNEVGSWQKDNRRSGGRERKFQDPYRINPAMEFKRQDPRQDVRQEGRQDPRSNRGGDRGDRRDTDREPRQDRHDKIERPPRGDLRYDRGDRMDRQDRQERMDSRRQERQEILEMSNTILIKNLPEQCNDRDILDFFSELGVAPLNIHVVQDSVGQPTGEAYCQFENDEEADKAATKNGANMGRQVVSVEKVSPEEYEQAIGIWEPPPPAHAQPHPTRPMYNPLPALLPTPPEYHYRSTYQDEKESDRSSYGEDDRYDKKVEQRGGNRGNYGMNDRYGGGRMGGNNSGGGMRGGREGRGRGRTRFSGGPPPPLLCNNMGGDPMMSGGPMGGGGGPRGPPRGSPYGGGSGGGGNTGGGGGPPPGNPGGPYIDGDVVDNFGKPGCVVALENLHFRADIEEIIGLFSDFDVEHEDVIRRFDERGRPTGDARVSLKSPSEAMRAVRELQYRQLRGRTIKVSLLQN